MTYKTLWLNLILAMNSRLLCDWPENYKISKNGISRKTTLKQKDDLFLGFSWWFIIFMARKTQKSAFHKVCVTSGSFIREDPSGLNCDRKS